MQSSIVFGEFDPEQSTLASNSFLCPTLQKDNTNQLNIVEDYHIRSKSELNKSYTSSHQMQNQKLMNFHKSGYLSQKIKQQAAYQMYRQRILPQIKAQNELRLQQIFVENKTEILDSQSKNKLMEEIQGMQGEEHIQMKKNEQLRLLQDLQKIKESNMGKDILVIICKDRLQKTEKQHGLLQGFSTGYMEQRERLTQIEDGQFQLSCTQRSGYRLKTPLSGDYESQQLESMSLRQPNPIQRRGKSISGYCNIQHAKQIGQNASNYTKDILTNKSLILNEEILGQSHNFNIYQGQTSQIDFETEPQTIERWTHLAKLEAINSIIRRSIVNNNTIIRNKRSITQQYSQQNPTMTQNSKQYEQDSVNIYKQHLKSLDPKESHLTKRTSSNFFDYDQDIAIYKANEGPKSKLDIIGLSAQIKRKKYRQKSSKFNNTPFKPLTQLKIHPTQTIYRIRTNHRLESDKQFSRTRESQRAQTQMQQQHIDSQSKQVLGKTTYATNIFKQMGQNF